MYRRILVPTDGSSTSKRGLTHAIGLAKDQGAQVRLLNVVDDVIMMPAVEAYPVADMTFLLESLRKSGDKALAEGAELARRGGVSADRALVESRGRNVSDAILAVARKWRADLIVMGTHGRRGLNRLLLGSDAERVLRESAVPVLLVRGAAAARGTKTPSRARRSKASAKRPARR